MTQSLLFETNIDSGAILSSCGVYRYKLWRTWDNIPRYVNWLMLNPSVADATKDDNTIRKCVGYARDWGYGGIVVTNLFALRSTDPKWLLLAPDPASAVGPDNDRHVVGAAKGAGIVVCGWGANGAIGTRPAAVLRLLADVGVVPHCIARTKDGHPGHPLFLRKTLVPVPMEVNR